jgi:hypothetical protein
MHALNQNNNNINERLNINRQNNRNNINGNVRRRYNTIIRNNININRIIRNENRNIVRINNNIINNQGYREINFYNDVIYITTNRNIIRENQNIQNLDGEMLCNLFIILYEPNKIYCIMVLLLNIICCGFGTVLIGLNKKSIFYCLLGIIQCFCFHFFIVYGFTLKTKKIFGLYPIGFFHYYFKALAFLFYLSSIYISLFRNFIFCNPRKINYNENKEKGCFIFFLNILIGGLGTLFSSILIKINGQISICYSLKLIIFGLIQLSGYIFSLFGIALTSEKTNIKIGLFFFYGALCYFFSILVSFRLYKRFARVNNELNF